MGNHLLTSFFFIFMNYIIIYLIAVNIIAFAAMASDKKRARSKSWRIPESVLLTLAFIGGSIGALIGLLACRHKTKHLKFTILLPFFLLLHIAIALLLTGVI